MFSFTDHFDRISSGPMTLQIIEKISAGADGSRVSALSR